MAFAASPALYADTVVYATWKSGKDASGWIMGLQNLPLKIAVFLRGTILSACLVAVGWKSGVVLEGTARQGMTISFALVPAIFCLAGLLLLVFGFKITKEKVCLLYTSISEAMLRSWLEEHRSRRSLQMRSAQMDIQKMQQAQQFLQKLWQHKGK